MPTRGDEECVRVDVVVRVHGHWPDLIRPLTALNLRSFTTIQCDSECMLHRTRMYSVLRCNTQHATLARWYEYNMQCCDCLLQDRHRRSRCGTADSPSEGIAKACRQTLSVCFRLQRHCGSARYNR